MKLFLLSLFIQAFIFSQELGRVAVSKIEGPNRFYSRNFSNKSIINSIVFSGIRQILFSSKWSSDSIILLRIRFRQDLAKASVWPKNCGSIETYVPSSSGNRCSVPYETRIITMLHDPLIIFIVII